MDAVEFIKERNRMCKSYYDAENGHCGIDCPAYRLECTQLDGFIDDLEKLAGAVEEWSAAHPRKTRQSVFLEQWPEARIESDGISSICPAVLSKSYRMYSGGKCPTTITPKICADCRREFWSQEVD